MALAKYLCEFQDYNDEFWTFSRILLPITL